MFKKTEEKKLFPLPNSHYPISLKKKKNKQNICLETTYYKKFSKTTYYT